MRRQISDAAIFHTILKSFSLNIGEKEQQPGWGSSMDDITSKTFLFMHVY